MYLCMYANQRGEVLEHPGMSMLGRSGAGWMCPEAPEMIPLPRGASLVSMPGYFPVGLNGSGELECLTSVPGDGQDRVQAVAALLPQGFTRTLYPACVSDQGGGLPLLGYAAVGFKAGKMWVAAVQSDQHRKWHPAYYNSEGLPARINKFLKRYPDNRIYRQLARCALGYGCFTAQNIFYRRWEGGIPTSSQCNANCIGCISESHSRVAAPQERLGFNPGVEEIVQVGIEHLRQAREAIISFGQGCEGEPALNGRNLARAVQRIREENDTGTININTNAGCTEGIKLLCDAGLDAMRVTIFSCREENYASYHRPLRYRWPDVAYSIDYARSRGVHVSLNLLVFPGFSDREDEIEALIDFVRNHDINMIQLRNLNIDPEVLVRLIPGEAGIGIVNFIMLLQRELPDTSLGSYTHPVAR